MSLQVELCAHLAQDCLQAAERTKDPQTRELLLRHAVQWMQDALAGPKRLITREAIPAARRNCVHRQRQDPLRVSAAGLPRANPRWRVSLQTHNPYRCCSVGAGGGEAAVCGSASCSAFSGSMRPEPKLLSRSPGSTRLALAVRIRRMSAGLSFGLRSSRSATMPLTSAAATDVPVVI